MILRLRCFDGIECGRLSLYPWLDADESRMNGINRHRHGRGAIVLNFPGTGWSWTEERKWGDKLLVVLPGLKGINVIILLFHWLFHKGSPSLTFSVNIPSSLNTERESKERKFKGIPEGREKFWRIPAKKERDRATTNHFPSSFILARSLPKYFLPPVIFNGNWNNNKIQRRILKLL